MRLAQNTRASGATRVEYTQYKDSRHREWRESLYSVVMDVIEVCPAVFWGDVRLKKEYRRRYWH